MALSIEMEWQKPLPLQDDGFEYSVEWDDLPEGSGIYIFGRRYGDSVTPFYIGQAKCLSSRIWQQLNNAKLMAGIRRAENGHRVLLVGVCCLKPGQQLAKVLNVVERAYIEHALTKGHELLNKQGVRRSSHAITSSGPKKGHQPFPRRMKVQAR